MWIVGIDAETSLFIDDSLGYSYTGEVYERRMVFIEVCTRFFRPPVVRYLYRDIYRGMWMSDLCR